jgi:hypothetical protein
MRWCIEIFALLAACAAQAFDSEAWLAKRARLAQDASRLRAAYATCRAAVATPAENVTVPIESHPDGSVKTGVFAEKAQFFLKEGLVWGQGVKIRQYRTDGSLEAWIDAENCVIDRKTRCGWVNGRAKAKYRDEALLEGRGVYFSAEAEYLTVYSDTVLTTPERRLSSVRADYDHKEGVALFDGRVHLTGKEKERAYTFTTDRAYAFLSGTNDLRRIVALGNVTVASDKRTGACARAEYFKPLARITLYGNGPAAPARLTDETRRRSALEGSRIVFWLDSEQVEVADSRLSVDAKGFKLPKGPEHK